MSNYKKAFNFQNGVQVDDDNFVVTQNGLVGIGTSVPSKKLDVRGNADISGILTTSGMNVGAAVSVGANIIIDAASGIITATKFVGSAGNLSGIVAIATDGFIAQAGSLSTTAKVGIATDNPVFDLQIGLNPRTSIGVGITNGDVLISGVTTTGKLVVSGLTTTKDLFVSGVTTITSTLDANGAIDAPEVNVSGGVGVGDSIYHVDDTDTKIAFENDQISLNVAGSEKLKLTQGGFNFTGVSTFANAIDLNADLDVSGNVVIGSGATIGIGSTVFFGDDVKAVFGSGLDAEIFHDASAGINDFRIIDKIGHLKLETSSDKDVIIKTGSTQKTNLKAVATQGVELYFDGDKRFSTSGVGVTVYGQSDVTGNTNITGITTINNNLKVNGNVNLSDQSEVVIGGNNDLRLYHQSSDNTSRIVSKEKDLYLSTIDGTNHVYILSNNKNAIIANANAGVQLYHNNVLKLESIGIGASVYGQLNIASLNSGAGGLSSHYGYLRYGNESSGAPYSTRRSLDLVNTDSGNINYYINANNLEDTGDFHWHKGFSNTQLMTLTGIGGSLGIGVTEPVLPLHVGGGATITGNLFVGANLTVGNDMTLNGTILAPNASVTLNSLSANQVTSNLVGNINSTVGFSTLRDLEVTGVSTFEGYSYLGAGITISGGGQNAVVIEPTIDAMIINDIGQIGIRTDAAGIATDVMINASEVTATFGVVGVGTTRPDAAIDFRFAGTPNFTIPATAAYLENRRYMYPPKLTTTERDNLVGMTNGAMIYNSSGNQLQIYIAPMGWVGVSTETKIDS